MKKLKVSLKEKQKKNPKLAAILNFIFPGLGYFYIDRRRVFGILLILSTIGFAITIASNPALLIILIQLMFASQIGILIYLFIFGGLAYDAYNDAKIHNKGL